MKLTKHGKWLLAAIVAEIMLICGVLIWVWASTGPEPTTTTRKTTPTKTQDNPKATGPPIITPKLFAIGLEFPVGILNTGNKQDKRLFVVEQVGTIRILDEHGNVGTTPFLDLRDKVQGGGEMGLLGLAFHPKYTQNGFFYVNYVDKDMNTIIARYSLAKTTGLADPSSEVQLIKLKQPYPNHNGGDLAFGPDGYLYIPLGDGGSGSDPENRAHNMGVMFGKILRLDVNGKQPYAIPSSNPYQNTAGVLPEIWAAGLRNPWRISFDKKTGDLYIADVGQTKIEELNVQSAKSKGGEHYGWRCHEGTATFIERACVDSLNYVMPVLEYEHNENRCSITGGYVYRGTTYPNMVGKYFFADYCGGQIYYTENKDGEWPQHLAATTEANISSFGQDSGGELYISDHQKGTIYRLEDTSN